MRVLVVKTTSMGDVVHALPAVSDIAAALPGVHIDWLVERPFDAIVALHPAVDRVLVMAWRRWRKKLFERTTWHEMGALRRLLRELRYDLVIDMQGLLKSALWARQARGLRAGYDRHSIREPLASFTYDRTAAVSPGLHAVDRCRQLAAAHLGYAVPAGAPRFGLRAPPCTWQPRHTAYAVLNPNASVDSKLWPQGHWIELARALRDRGLHGVVMWGSQAEAARAREIAAACGGEVPPFLAIADAAAVLAGARVVVGLDTGFTHLAAALGAATIGLFRDHEPSQVGVTGDGHCRSLGGIGKTPRVDEVIAALPQAWT